MSNRGKVIVVLVCVILFIAASIFCWAYGGAWTGFAPAVAVLLAEYGLQCRRHKTWRTPILMTGVRLAKKVKIVNRVKRLIGRRRKNQLSHPTPRHIISTISDLLLKDFIRCCVYNEYSVLGEGTETELKAAFTKLLSQYYEVKNDERVKYEVKLRREIAALELRQYKVAVLSGILYIRYSLAAAEGLRKLYPAYKFTEQTMLHDLDMVAKAEIGKRLERERACGRLERLYTQKENDSRESKERQYRNFVARLMDINKTEGVRYDIATITVMEYAIAEARLADHIATLKEQANGRR